MEAPRRTPWEGVEKYKRLSFDTRQRASARDSAAAEARAVEMPGKLIFSTTEPRKDKTP